MKNKPNYYAIIPARVRYDKTLKDKAKLLYGEIIALSNAYGYCFSSNKYFADLYDVSISTISSLIKDLVDRGYLKRTIIYKEGTQEILHRYLEILVEPYTEISVEGYTENLEEGYTKFSVGGIPKICKDNNTSINNTSINNKKEKELNKKDFEIAEYNWLDDEGSE